MKTISIYLTLSLMIIGFIGGSLFGFFITPTYQKDMYEKEEMGLGKADKYVDLRYLNKMATHHLGAMELARQISGKTDNKDIEALSKEILANEPKLIEELRGWKVQWYKDSGKFKDPVVPQFGEKDDKINLRFLNALIAHHEEGIEMAQEIKTKSSRNEVLDNADAVEKFLTDSLVMLENWREKLYKIK